MDIQPGVYSYSIEHSEGRSEHTVHYTSSTEWVSTVEEPWGRSEAAFIRGVNYDVFPDEGTIFVHEDPGTERLAPDYPMLNAKALRRLSEGQADRLSGGSLAPSGLVSGGGSTGYVEVPEQVEILDPDGSVSSVVAVRSVELGEEAVDSALDAVERWRAEGYSFVEVRDDSDLDEVVE